jgi:hypothetical protein
LCLRSGMFANANLVERIPKVDGFYALSIKEAREAGFRLFHSDHEPRPGLARFVGISQITSATNPMLWLARSDYMPMITAGQKAVFANRDETITALRMTNFSPEAVVYLPAEARDRVSATNAGHARVISARVLEHRLEVEVEAKAPAMVVIAQAWYPAWQAFVNGEPVRIWRANHAFQAVEVGRGTHRITLAYHDKQFLWGACISGFALCGVGASFLRTSRKCTGRAPVRDTVAAPAGCDGEAAGAVCVKRL